MTNGANGLVNGLSNGSASAMPTILIVAPPSEGRDLQRWLESDGCKAQLIKDGKKVVSAIRKSPPSLIIFSSELPSYNNFELCQQLKSDEVVLHEFGFIPVVFLTSTEQATLSFDVGADDVLVRPLSEGLALGKIRALLRQKAQYDSLAYHNQHLTEELALRKQESERMLRESRELLVLKDTIVRNVSHELRTPMLQIKSAVAMLAEDARAASDNGTSILADHATAATAKLESVVQNITQLAASLNVKLEPFQVSDAINAVTRILSRQWASSNAVERIQIRLEKVPPVMGDRGGVTQVLRQLLDNAFKFSPDGGPIEIIAEQQGNQVCIAVRDYGIGIAHDQLEQIFQAFYQVDGSSTRAFGGTGVGLAIVKLLLDGMGTKISVESEVGSGSTFSFLLPIAQLDDISLPQNERVR